MWSSLKVTAGSYFLVVLRLRIDSIVGLAPECDRLFAGYVAIGV
jgi:hypothetical protein